MNIHCQCVYVWPNIYTLSVYVVLTYNTNTMKFIRHVPIAFVIMGLRPALKYRVNKNIATGQLTTSVETAVVSRVSNVYTSLTLQQLAKQRRCIFRVNPKDVIWALSLCTDTAR